MVVLSGDDMDGGLMCELEVVNLLKAEMWCENWRIRFRQHKPGVAPLFATARVHISAWRLLTASSSVCSCLGLRP